MSISRSLLWLAVCFALNAVGIQLMANAVDRNDPSSARTVFVVLMLLGACIGWIVRGLVELRRRRAVAAILDGAIADQAEVISRAESAKQKALQRRDEKRQSRTKVQ